MSPTHQRAVWFGKVDETELLKLPSKVRFSDIELVKKANDILNQNIGFDRNINDNFISERTYNTMRRYFMLSFIWNFSKNGKPME